MALTGYVSSSGVQQVFTTGPFSGSIVTSSYSNGTNLFGPVIDFTQLFVSGVLDIITLCNTNSYYRYYQDISSCLPPTACLTPTILSIARQSCIENTAPAYTVNFNSASVSASYTIINYSFSPTFASNWTKISTNSINNGTISFNTSTDSGIISSPDNTVYIRAYNSCSNGATSSWSDTLSYQCFDYVEQTYLPITVEFKNNSGQTVIYEYKSIEYSVLNNNTTSFSVDDEFNIDLNFSIIGNNFYTGEVNEYSYYYYNMIVSSSDAVNGNISTIVTPQIYVIPTEPTLINIDYNPATSVPFNSDGLTATTTDVSVSIDRSQYLSAATIKLNISI
jgi:hypothetical protein